MKPLEKASRLIVDRLGTCPLDLFDWEHLEKCECVCPENPEDAWKCWYLYFDENNSMDNDK